MTYHQLEQTDAASEAVAASSHVSGDSYQAPRIEIASSSPSSVELNEVTLTNFSPTATAESAETMEVPPLSATGLVLSQLGLSRGETETSTARPELASTVNLADASGNDYARRLEQSLPGQISESDLRAINLDALMAPGVRVSEALLVKIELASRTRTTESIPEQRQERHIPGYDASRNAEHAFRRDIHRSPGDSSAEYRTDQSERVLEVPGSQDSNEYWKNYWQRYFAEFNRRQESGDSEIPEGGRSLARGIRIHDVARQSVGKKMWEQSDFAHRTQNGRLGSTSSISEVLQEAGFDYANAPGTSSMVKILLSRGWKPVAVNELRAGDIVYGGKSEDWQKGGGKSHMAIVGEGGRVYGNDPENGTWSEKFIGDVFNPGVYGDRIWALRPPEHDIYVPPKPDGHAMLANLAEQNLGQQLWRFIRGVPSRLGCATSVSAVLNQAGFTYARHAGVGGLEQQLVNHGWQKLPISEMQPGDVVIGARSADYRRGGGRSHVGIAGHGKTYHNSGGRWIESSWNYFNSGRYRHGVWVLRPPANA